MASSSAPSADEGLGAGIKRCVHTLVSARRKDVRGAERMSRTDRQAEDVGAVRMPKGCVSETNVVKRQHRQRSRRLRSVMK